MAVLLNPEHPMTQLIIDYLKQNKKIYAIKIHRELYNTSLKEAKDEIEYYMEHNKVIRNLTPAMILLIDNHYVEDAKMLYMSVFRETDVIATEAINKYLYTPNSLTQCLQFLTEFVHLITVYDTTEVKRRANASLSYLAEYINNKA